jgi:hypothetical protein
MKYLAVLAAFGTLALASQSNAQPSPAGFRVAQMCTAAIRSNCQARFAQCRAAASNDQTCRLERDACLSANFCR